MDNIRSQCFATFESKEQAAGTRAEVYDMVWPVVGGRRLTAEFATAEEAAAAAEGKTKSATERRHEAVRSSPRAPREEAEKRERPHDDFPTKSSAEKRRAERESAEQKKKKEGPP